MPYARANWAMAGRSFTGVIVGPFMLGFWSGIDRAQRKAELEK